MIGNETIQDDYNAAAGQPKGKDREMTPGEIELARSVFGNSINYSKVRIHNSTYLPACAQGRNIITPNGELYCGANYCDDFSKTDAGTQRLFVHEMTHVWQYQNNILDPRLEAVKTLVEHWGKYSDAYA